MSASETRKHVVVHAAEREAATRSASTTKEHLEYVVRVYVATHAAYTAHSTKAAHPPSGIAWIVCAHVVSSPLISVTQDIIGLIYVLEHLVSLLTLLLTALVPIRVPLECELPISLLDLVVGRSLLHTKYLVVVFLGSGFSLDFSILNLLLYVKLIYT